MTFDPKGQAQRMAARWYERPQSGCDEATLAELIERVLRDAYRQGCEAATEDIRNSILKAFGLHGT